jgi:hypothetical protein
LDETVPLAKRRRSKTKTMAEQKSNESAANPVDAVREINQLFVQSLIGAQRRNMQFAQSTFTSAVEVLKGHIGATRALIQQVEQQEAFQRLTQGIGGTRMMEPSLEVLRSVLSSYEQALETAEKTTRQGLQGLEKAVEGFEQAALQPPRPGTHRQSKSVSS